jgi:hypothetical protein
VSSRRKAAQGGLTAARLRTWRGSDAAAATTLCRVEMVYGIALWWHSPPARLIAAGSQSGRRVEGVPSREVVRLGFGAVDIWCARG